MAPKLAAAPKVSSYKHVAFRHGRVGKPWQAVVWKQGHAHYYGCHTTELGAAKVVAKKLGLPGPQSLAKHTQQKAQPNPKPNPQRSHRYVYWHVGNQRWVAQVGQSYYGEYQDYNQAVKCIVQKSGLSEAQLRLDPEETRANVQGQRGMVAKHADWFAHMWQCYRLSPNKVANPGDLRDMHGRTHGPAAALLRIPHLIVIMLLAKYGPHRDALQEARVHIGAPPEPHNDAKASRWAYDVVVEALRRIAKVPHARMQPWWDGPGKHTSHHSGLVVIAHRTLGILTPMDQPKPKKSTPRGKKPTPKGKKPTPKCKPTPKVKKLSKSHGQRASIGTLVLNKGQRTFTINPYNPTVGTKLNKLRLFGEALLKLPVAKTVTEWAQRVESMQKKPPTGARID